NLRTQYSYDKNGNLIAKIDANQNITRNFYDANDQLSYAVDARGAVTKYEYDANGNVVKKTAYINLLTTITTDATQLEKAVVVDATRDHMTRNSYDANNRLNYTVDAIGAVAKYEYDANGNIVKKTEYASTILASTEPSAVVVNNDKDRITQYVYDAAN